MPEGTLFASSERLTPDKILTFKDILNLPMGPNDAQASTVREYLAKLLALIWVEGEGFDGKRPFGNSSWEDELTRTVVGSGFAESDDDAFGVIGELLLAWGDGQLG